LAGHKAREIEGNMTRRALAVLCGVFLLASGTAAWAASEDDKRIINGPSQTAFGGLQLVLGQGASAEAKFQPDASKLTVKTLVGEARIITSARNLILVENTEGRTEILLPNGRLIVVEPGKAEIVGRALVDEPGNIIMRLSGTGPIAQAGGVPPEFTQSTVDITILQSVQPSLIDSLQDFPGPNRFCSDCGTPVSPSTP
jgi:hypothetical protein